ASMVPRGHPTEPAPGMLAATPAALVRLAEQDSHRQIVEITADDAGSADERRDGETGSPSLFWVALVTVGDEIVGRVWVGPIAGSPGTIELRAMEHGTTVVALELL